MIMDFRYLFLSLLFVSVSAFAQQSERVYVSSDRDWYAAGETVFLSAFCMDMDADAAVFSPVSAVAYVELASKSGRVAGTKVSLIEGRGAGMLTLPRSLPTGNYSLRAYTSLGKEKVPESKVISIFNTLSTARVADGVVYGELPESLSVPSTAKLSVERTGERVLLTAPEDCNVSVSVFRKEPFPSYNNWGIKGVLRSPAGPGAKREVPEYDGEILTLRFTDAEGAPLDAEGASVFVAHPGNVEDIYASSLGRDGLARFYTDNLFGHGDLVVALDASALPFNVEVVDPFVGVVPDSIPPLLLNPSFAESLSALNVRMQLTSAFDADTLYTHLPTRSLAFLPDECVRYNLDDYTRFATFQEVFVEFLSDIRIRGREENLQLQVRCRERTKGALSFRDEPSLILLDGVPVLQHRLITQLDPTLVRRVDVYPRVCALGGSVYSGIANFITFKGDMGGLRFGDNVKILEYEGPAFPVSFGPTHDDRYPDVRETLLWHPLVELRADEPYSLPLFDTDEDLVLVVEGLSRSGAPIYFKLESL